MKTSKLYLATAMGMMLASGYPVPYSLRKPGPKQRVCLLPDCANVTYHNGGYCSAAHCKEHKQMLRTAKNKKLQTDVATLTAEL